MIYSLIHRLWDLKEGGLRYRTLQQLNAFAYAKPCDQVAQQQKQLRILFEAAQHTPYYQTIIAREKIDLTNPNPLQILSQFPILTKTDIRNNNTHLINPKMNKKHHRFAKTGGSTGVSLSLVFDQDCQKKRNGAQMFADSFAHWQPGEMVAAVWGNPPAPKGLKQKLRRSLLERVIYLDTMALNVDSVKKFVEQWRSHQPTILFGHAHSLYLLAQLLREMNIFNLSPKGIVSTSMMLLQHEREFIEQIFNCKVTNRYGCEEVGLIAVECEQHQGMHLNAGHLIVECLDDNFQPVPKGQSGKLVITDLNNLAMPLIRYRIEDVGVLSNRECACGRTLPILEKLEGRVADFLKKSDGSLVAGVSLVERTLTNIRGIEQLQLIQPAINQLIINRVAGPDYSPDTDHQLTEELKAVFGKDISITIKDTHKIAQESNGKYRFSICKI